MANMKDYNKIIIKAFYHQAKKVEPLASEKGKLSDNAVSNRLGIKRHVIRHLRDGRSINTKSLFEALEAAKIDFNLLSTIEELEKLEKEK